MTNGAGEGRGAAGAPASLLAQYLWQNQTLAVALVDGGGRILSANEGLVRLAAGAAVGRRLEELVAPAQRAALARLLVGAGAEWTALRIGLAPDASGVPRDHLVSVASAGDAIVVVAEPLVADVVAVNNRLLTLTDELVAVERELRRTSGELVEQNERLVELDRLKDEFVSLISHEFRTPLTSMHGYLDLLREDEATFTPKQREFLEVLERNAKRMLRLVDDLLFVAQLDAGKLRIVRESVDAAALVREAVASIHPLAQHKGVDVAVADLRVVRISADRARLAQLLDNLLTNAVKFTPAGGRVDVEVGGTSESAVIEVRDTGIGIPGDEREHVFERFFRTTRAGRRAIPGSGLGLAVAKSIVEAHGGTIAVASSEGAGATFRVELPVGARAEAAQAAGAR